MGCVLVLCCACPPCVAGTANEGLGGGGRHWCHVVLFVVVVRVRGRDGHSEGFEVVCCVWFLFGSSLCLSASVAETAKEGLGGGRQWCYVVLFVVVVRVRGRDGDLRAVRWFVVVVRDLDRDTVIEGLAVLVASWGESKLNRLWT